MIIALTGGIGAGKSVVAHALRALGRPVYDCDSEARRLQEESHEMRQRIATEITPDALLADGSLNRPALAACVFADPRKLARLNAIVHSAVAADLKLWAEANSERSPLFVETAILYESGFDKMVDEVWEVTAPQALRLERVKRRSGLTDAQILSRMAAQEPPLSRKNHRIIVNDDISPLIPQILNGLDSQRL